MADDDYQLQLDPEEDDVIDHKPSCFDRYYDGVVRFRILIILAWLVILVLGIIIGPGLLNDTATTFSAPPGTMAYDAAQVYKDEFTQKPWTMFVLIANNADRPSVLTNFTEDFTHGLVDKMHNAPSDASIVLNVTGYYTFIGSSVYGIFAPGFVSDDKQATLIEITYTRETGAKEVKLIEYVQDALHDLRNGDDSYKVGLTGTDVLFYDVITGGVSDMASEDMIVLPLALSVLAFVVKSCRLILLTIIGVLLSITTSFMIMVPIAKNGLTVASFAPNIMMSLIVAMSIDYSLFLLTRFREEVIRGTDKILAVKRMLMHGGEIVAVSGCTLAVTFAGLAFFPLDFLRSVGIGSCVALISCVAVNLILHPAMLLTFYGFFGNFGCNACCVTKCGCVGCNEHMEEAGDTITSLNSGAVSRGSSVPPSPAMKSFDNLSTRQSQGAFNTTPPSTSLGVCDGCASWEVVCMDHCTGRKDDGTSPFWKKSAIFSTNRCYAIGIILFTFALVVPIAVYVEDMEVTIDNTQLFPRDAEALDVFHEMQNDFTAGKLSPYYVILKADQPQDIYSEEFFTSSSALCQKLVADNVIQAHGVSFYSVLNDNGVLKAVDANTVRPFLIPSINPSAYNSDPARTYRYLVNGMVNAQETAATIVLQTDFDPLNDQAKSWLKNLRASLADFKDPNGKNYGLFVTGGATDEIDAVDRIYELFPYEILLTGALVFMLIAVIFKSLFIPLKFAVTVALPITLVYGLGVLIFCRTDLIYRQVSALFWLTPVMSFSILVGLGLDYDVFLFGRIMEYRKAGYTDRAAIIKGVEKTGSIITAAGIIMSIAFAGLLRSSQMLLNQFGFMLCVAVLVDTFLVRTLMVPATMALAGNINWWPGKMPPGLKTEDDDSDAEDDDDCYAVVDTPKHQEMKL